MNNPVKYLLPGVWLVLAVSMSLTGCGDDHGDRFRKDRHRYPQRYEQPDDRGRERQPDREKDENRRDRDSKERRNSSDRIQQRPPEVRIQPPPPAPPAPVVPVAPPAPVVTAVPRAPVVPPAPAAPIIPVESPYVVENRGLVHEAFAVPVIFDPTPGFIVSKPPPALIDEVPPDQRPQGDDVAWIPGYWGWDDERSDFIWVSGIWRNMPPERQFVPGYWRGVQGGFQWVSGFWQTDSVETVQYLPPPPESLESGPVGQPPRPNHIWVPGVWVWRQTTYLWRPGCWIPPKDDWVWVPAHYVWTPSGYVFVSGYWDHIVPRRGVLFAPIRVAPQVLARRAFVYSPNAVVNVSMLIGDLFARPRYDHFYFGDYYDRAFFRSGIYPVVSFHNSRYGYDPVFARYVATQHMAPDEFTRRLRDEYNHRRDHPEARPPRTYPTPPKLEARHDIDFRVTVQPEVVEPLSKTVKRPDLPVRFESVSQDRIKQYRQTIAETRQYKDHRRDVETPKPATTSKQPVPVPTIRSSEPKKGPSEDRSAPKPAQVRPTPPQAGKASTPPAQTTPRVVKPGQPAVSEKIQQSPGQPTQLHLKKSPLASRPRNLLGIFKTTPAQPKVSAPDPKVKPGTRSTNRREPQE